MQAIIAVTLSSLLSFLLQPLAFLISGSVVGLITLRKGIANATQALVISFIILQIFFVFLSVSFYVSTIILLMIWLPILFSSAILRFTQSQGVLVLFLGLISIIFTIVFYLLLGDVAAWWQDHLTKIFEAKAPSHQIEAYKEILESNSSLIHGMIFAAYTLNMITGVLLARWWQSKLFNPGGFRKEFYRLSIPIVILPVFIIIGILAFNANEPWQDMCNDILIILTFMYLIQGISFSHRTVHKLKLSRGWLVFLYCSLILLPQMAAIVACLGIVDAFTNWKTKDSQSEKES
tara:strand:+ start:79 stop:951 length:873 start_codon:yes stop_codon:yes gene_type:complete